MDRPSRKTRVIDYRDLDDDEDFARVKPRDGKRPRDTTTEERKKPPSHCSQDSQPSAEHKTRKPLDQKLYERDLEAAVTLSLLHNTDDDDDKADLSPTMHTDQHSTMGLSPTMDLSPTMHTDQHPTMGLSPTVPTDQYPTMGLSATTGQSPTLKEVADEGDENQDPSSRRFSNCSVNVNLLGLDEIHTERGSSKRKPPPKTTEPPRGQPKDKDEDYQPQLTPESESEDNEVAESEDEEFTVRKAKKSKKETRKVEKKTKSPPPPASKIDKQTPKPSKAKPPATATAPVRTPASPPVRTPPPPSAANQVSVPGKQPPAGGSKVPRWNPPGHVGRSPSSSSSSSPSPSSLGSGVRSPGQGLRLGLSRRVRVKPLHPSMTSH